MATQAPPRRRKFWGWGYEDQQPSHEEVEAAAAGMVAHLGFGASDVERPARVEDLDLPEPRLTPPAALEAICATDAHSRASHALGKAYRDVVRAFRGQIEHPPDVVACPGDERQLEQVLDWCSEAGAAAIPYGGGTSVAGGVEPRFEQPAVSIDLGALTGVREVDPTSLAARIGAGTAGPALEDELREHDLTLRHYPQSFELSTLGGWIATRAGGHFATGPTHIDDLVESVRALTPQGVWESRRLPGSGAGPSPDRMLIGSEGILGVITEAWMRIRPRPKFRASASVGFASFGEGAAAVRALAQSGLEPANCRLLDPREAGLTGAGDGETAVLVLGFESAGHPLDVWLARGLELCGDHGGRPLGEPRLSGPGDEGGGRGESAGAWRSAFLQAPYLRDTMVAAGVLSETFETAITWDRFDAFVAEVGERAERAVAEECGEGRVTCRLTHAYRDGAAPYFTVLAPARRGGEVEQWDAVKAAVTETLIAAGGTVTHHHAVGRDHRPGGYDVQRPEPFAEALRAAKRAVDPQAILNPGVLIDPLTSRRRELARADRVLPGLWRLRLPLPWPAVPHVNAFAVAAGNGVVLVDCGLFQPGSLGGLRQALGQAGLSLEHVRLLVCTHAHGDHYGQAAAIVEETGCELWMHPNHAHTTAAAEDPDATLRWRLEVARHSGTPVDDLEAYESARRGRESGLSGIVMPDRELVDGVEVDTDLGTWRAYETPGHAPSHVVLHQPERGLLLSGDHLLGRVSLYYDHGYTPDPAGEFLSSLDVVEGLDVNLVLAGHGRPVRDAPGLIAANRRTIGARLDAIRTALAGGPRPAYDLVDAVLIAAELPTEIPAFARVSWIFPETLSYLGHLEQLGEVTREEDGDRELWQLA